MKIAIISNPKKLSSKLTQFFTGSPAYHICFVDESIGKMWDMNLLFRRRLWPHYKPENVTFYQCPVNVTVDDLELWLDTDEDWYSVLEYTAFAIKKIFTGYKPSFKGAICSEKVAQILEKNGWLSPFESTPSPADFEKVLIKI